MSQNTDPDSTRVYLSDAAYLDIVLEVSEHQHVETGCALLGHRLDSDYYAVSAIDPGLKAQRQLASFEYDHTYQSHLCSIIARRYEAPPKLLGLCHRHPGDMDEFSETDHRTHETYLKSFDRFVSGIINVDPLLRMTFFEVKGPPLEYTPVQVVVGDQFFPEEMLLLRDPEELLSEFRQDGEETVPSTSSATQNDASSEKSSTGQSSHHFERGLWGLFHWFITPRKSRYEGQ